MNQEQEKFDVSQLSASQTANMKQYLMLCDDMISSFADRLHVSKEEVGEILDGKRTVARIIYGEKRSRRYLRVAQRLGIASLMIITLCCFTIPGFADDVRSSVIRLFVGQSATRVEAVRYDSEADLDGLIVPTVMLEGFLYRSHRESESGMYHVEYANAGGQSVYYYYYPNSASVSYDNELTQTYSLPYTGGTMTVLRETAGPTSVYFPYSNGAFIQMDFQADISDSDLRTIAESVKRE